MELSSNNSTFLDNNKSEFEEYEILPVIAEIIWMHHPDIYHDFL